MSPFRKGTRLLAAASVILLLEAVAHTIGTLSPPPDDPAIQAVVTAMRELRVPLGLGMEPSAWGINRSLGLAMTVALTLMGVMGLALPGAAPGSRRVYRTTAWLLAGANLAMLVLWWSYEVLPPFTFQVLLTPLLLWAALARGPEPAAHGSPATPAHESG